MVINTCVDNSLVCFIYNTIQTIKTRPLHSDQNLCLLLQLQHNTNVKKPKNTTNNQNATTPLRSKSVLASSITTQYKCQKTKKHYKQSKRDHSTTSFTTEYQKTRHKLHSKLVSNTKSSHPQMTFHWSFATV